MQCQLCDKAATVHLTEIVNGAKIEKHLCEDCAQKEGITIKSLDKNQHQQNEKMVVKSSAQVNHSAIKNAVKIKEMER